MDFTYQEKYAIIFALQEIMKADGIIDPREQKYMNEMYTRLNISVEDLSYVIDIDFLSCRNIILSMSEQKRNEALGYFVRMSACDGFVDPRETDIIDNFRLSHFI